MGKRKQIIQRSFALGALMAFVITGSALAGAFEDGLNVEDTLSEGGKHNVGVSAPDSDTVIDKEISYKYILTQGSANTNIGVSTVYIDRNGKTFTYNKAADIFLSTDLTGTGNNSANGLVMYDGKAVFNDALNVTVNALGENGKSAYGLSVMGGESAVSIIELNGKQVTVNVNTETARQTSSSTYCEAAGVSVYKADLLASENTDVEINVNGLSDKSGATPVYGILNEAGNIDFKGETTVNVTAKGAGGDAYSKKDAAGTAIGIKVIDGMYNSTLGNQSGHTETKLNNVNVNVKSEAANGKVVAIQVTDFDSDNTEYAQLEVNGNIKVEAEGATARGIEVKSGTYAKLGSDKTESIDINVKSTNEENASNIGVFVLSGGKADINTEKLTIDVDGTNSFGVHVQNNTQTEDAPENAATLNIIADEILINSTELGVSAFSNGQLNVNGNLVVNAKNAIDARGNSTININTDREHTTVLNGDIVFETPYTQDDPKGSGNLINANVNVNLSGSDSSWTGKAYQEFEGGTTIDLDNSNAIFGNVTGFSMTISDGAAWNMTGGSFINNVELADGGVINMQEEVTTLNAGAMALDNGAVNLLGEGQQVNVMNAEGSGTVNTNSLENKMRIASLTDGTALTVNGSSSITDQIASGDADLQALANVVSTGEGDDEKSAAVAVTTEEGKIAGAYSAQVDEDGNVVAGSVREAVNSTNKALAESGSALRLHWRAHMNDMNKRMGELRDSKGEHGVWARMTRGENEYRSVTSQYNLYQLGYDEKLSSDPTWTVGAALTHSEGSSSFAKGSTDDKSTGLAIYGSKLNDDGSFIDLIAKYARMDSDVTLGASKGDYSTNGYSVSAEYGKRFTNASGLWLEPQAELTYGYIGSAEYNIAGRNVTLDGMKSFIGRLGFALGKNISKGNVYARASYLYDFDGEAEGRFTDGTVTRSVEEDLGGGWWEVGVGANINLSKATHLYVDLEKTYGGEVDTRWQWNAGVRYSF